MDHWVPVEHVLQILDPQTYNLYPVNVFPIEVRYYFRDWIQNQRWEKFSLEKTELNDEAEALLTYVLKSLEELANQAGNAMERMKLLQIHKSMAAHTPLPFAVMVRDILMQEKALMDGCLENEMPPLQSLHELDSNSDSSSDSNSGDLEKLRNNVTYLQELRKRVHRLQEEVNWERQNYETLQATAPLPQPNGMELKTAELNKLTTNILKIERWITTESERRFKLLRDCVTGLELCQAQFITRLKLWKWEQYRSSIGHPFDDNLDPLQSWCEHLLGVNMDLRQEITLIGQQLPDLLERLDKLLPVLIENSAVVEKQPPQVIKTQSKFCTTVRYLLGNKLTAGTAMRITAQIVNEQQARNMENITSNDNVGEVINNGVVLELTNSNRSACALFRNMSIKKIKRADRKGSESVTEEKFALLFATEADILGTIGVNKIKILSHPVVVIVHGSQDNNALATIIWDCAFAEADRRPFVVPDSVPWRMMSNTLNMKFTSEVQTKRQLQDYNTHFLAEKIFCKQDSFEHISNMMVSWAQFNKEVLPGRPFTFWQWFEGTMDLTKKHLRLYWDEGLIFGFIAKQHLHYILRDSPNGTFLLRFSDSEIGGITIAYVVAAENGARQVQNIQPFTRRDLEIRCLGDRIRDINEITYLYPNYPKHDAFKKFYSGPQQPVTSGYLPVSLHTRVGSESTLPAPDMTPQLQQGFIGDPLSTANIQNMDEVSVDPTLQLPSMVHQTNSVQPGFIGDNSHIPLNMAHQHDDVAVSFPEDALPSSDLPDLNLDAIPQDDMEIERMPSFESQFSPLNISRDSDQTDSHSANNIEFELFDPLNC